MYKSFTVRSENESAKPHQARDCQSVSRVRHAYCDGSTDLGCMSALSGPLSDVNSFTNTLEPDSGAGPVRADTLHVRHGADSSCARNAVNAARGWS